MRTHCSPEEPQPFGVMMVGPVLMNSGSTARAQRGPYNANGQKRWAALGHGVDRAFCRVRAIRRWFEQRNSVLLIDMKRLRTELQQAISGAQYELGGQGTLPWWSGIVGLLRGGHARQRPERLHPLRQP